MLFSVFDLIVDINSLVCHASYTQSKYILVCINEAELRNLRSNSSLPFSLV